MKLPGRRHLAISFHFHDIDETRQLKSYRFGNVLFILTHKNDNFIVFNLILIIMSFQKLKIKFCFG